MTDPGAQAVVAPALHAQRARANHLDQLAKLVHLAGKRAVFVLSFVLTLLLVLVRNQEPNCVLEQRGIGKFDSAVLFAGHGMSAEKTLRGLPAKYRPGTRHDFSFGAASI